MIVSSGDGDRREGIIFVEGSSGRSGGHFAGDGDFWATRSPSNAGIAVAFTAMAGLALTATLVYSRRGSLKSPWSRQKRKHALIPKQWKRFFDTDGRLVDGGVKFLKKVRRGGVDPSIRAEVWPFLLGLYDVKSSKEERHSIRIKKRKEYENLQRRCHQMLRGNEKSFKLKESSGNSFNLDSGELSQVLDSPHLGGGADLDHSLRSEAFKSSRSLPEDEGSNSGITSGDSDLSDSDTSEEIENMHPLLASEGVEDVNFDDDTEKRCTCSKSQSGIKSYTTEDFSKWQRIIHLDAMRANPEWVIYSPSQAAVSSYKARQRAVSVGLKDFDHLEPCRIFHAARLVAILEAYALYDPQIGYCQGMSDLLSPIISVMEEEYEAFWCFVYFMKKARHNFRLDEVGITRQLNVVANIIKCKDSHLYRHLEKLEAEDCYFVYRMVVVLFRRELNFEQTLCLWEVMWADQAAIRAGIGESGWGRMRTRAPATDDLLLYAIAACVLQKKKLIIDMSSSMDEIMRECNSMAGHLDVWKLLDDAHDLVVTLHDKI